MTGGWRPPTPVSVAGVEGLDDWPSISRVVHVDPSSDITVSGAMLGNKSRLQVLNVSGVVEEFASVAGVIVVPAAVVVDAMARRLKLRLLVDNVVYGGDIVYLPLQESEEFSKSGAISSSGENTTTSGYGRTLFVNVAGARELVVSAKVPLSRLSTVFAYDSDRMPLRILLPYSSEDYVSAHITIDDDVVFVKACSSLDEFTPSLIVYFD